MPESKGSNAVKIIVAVVSLIGAVWVAYINRPPPPPPPPPPTPSPTVSPSPTAYPPPVVTPPPTASPSPTITPRVNHTAKIEITAISGHVGAFFSKYAGRNWHGGTNRTPLWSCDDHSSGQRGIDPGSPVSAQVEFGGAGVYIFDLSDWADPTVASVTFTIDDVVRFKGSGSAGKIEQWTDKYFGPNTRIADEREIAIDLD